MSDAATASETTIVAVEIVDDRGPHIEGGEMET